MRNKILRKLNRKANEGKLIFPLVQLRDDILNNSVIHKFLLKRFYTLFADNIRDLDIDNKIIFVDNSMFGITFKEVEESYPSYSSNVEKTPADYGFEEDDIRLYVGLNSKEVQDFLEKQKRFFDHKAKEYFDSY